MGLITGVMSMLFGDGRNAVSQTVEAFRENAENAAQRAADGKSAALAQFATEFVQPRKGLFDRLVDAINRLPRPALALGTIALFVSAMWHPVWFADRMIGVALIPEPLWWLMGAIVSFYFGARHQAKGQDFQRSVVQSVALTQAVTAPTGTPDPKDENAALAEWWASHGR
ncbi:holin family protein [Yoonia sp. R2331]|uniref:holin family protein n=1 Tax=Yoonia sp. R2331 TaxID=3237238 RepID=UPI0034E44AEE